MFAILTYKTVLSYCLKCRKNTESLRVVKKKNRRMMFLSSCTVCGSKKSRFIKEQKAKVFFSR